jgi:hypothetical protein
MGLGTKAWDWRVYGESGVAAGFIGATGTFWFLFQSDEAGVIARVKLKGKLGYGFGINLSSVAIPSASTWSSITCDSAFSIWDLHMAPGDISSFGFGAGGASWSYVSIGAYKKKTWFFSDQSVGGFSGGGAGISAFSMPGTWSFLKEIVDPTIA